MTTCQCTHRRSSHAYTAGANTGRCLAVGCGCEGYEEGEGE